MTCNGTLEPLLVA
uniref:Uncharacterized protein n=1 Tax=Anguilla anguilla TaxID=7936 RepID=A0A0E9PWS4_ANGAN